MTLFRNFSRKSRKVPFIAGLILSLGLVLGGGAVGVTMVHAETANCDSNAVVYCGASSVSALQQKYNNGDTRNKAYSIQDIYHAFGMGPSDITAMSSDAVAGYVTKSGDVYATVNGRSTLVATGAYTAGRQNIAGSTQHTYGATTYYQRSPSVSFLENSLSAMVIMKNGVFQHAILNSCGNPVNATPKKTTPPPAPKPPTPFYSCVQLTGSIPGDNNQMARTFTATAKFGGGATLSSADFDFGDGISKKGVRPASGSTSITVQHTYSKASTYSAKAILHFSANGKDVTAAACAARVTPNTPPTPECKPGVPVGSPACTPCQYDSSLPSDSPQCVAPTPPSLPNTGAGDTIAIFAVVVVAGFLVYRQIIFRKHRATFLAAQQGTTPLPLSDPLNEMPDPTQQIATSALHRQKRFRRRRSY